eukprot:scaffold49227_cov33-Cyclotella_meneghiniana.AAC.2
MPVVRNKIAVECGDWRLEGTTCDLQNTREKKNDSAANTADQPDKDNTQPQQCQHTSDPNANTLIEGTLDQVPIDKD